MPAYAAPSTSESLASAQAQATTAEAQLDTMRQTLTDALARYDQASTQLDATQQELANTANQIVQIDSDIEAAQERINERAVEIYKSGGLGQTLEILLATRSVPDLISRLDFLGVVQNADTSMLVELAGARDQSSELQRQQLQRQSDLTAQRAQLASIQTQVQSAVAKQEALIRSLNKAVASLVARQEQEQAAAAAAAAAGGTDFGGSAPPVPFNPNTLVSDAVYLNSTALDAAGVQAFLNSQPGSLKSFSAPDHKGVVKSAAQMIAEAAVAWGVSPKVILATLQKEQSLIADPSPSQTALDWAMGCGKTDSVTYTQYRGFGNQIWGGASKLKSNRAFWHAGISITIDGHAVYPSNASTHALYRYTPHFGGATSFWKLYWRYFGDPTK